jgi:hypothetical protein
MKNLKTLVTTSLFTLILGNIYAQDCSDLFISEYVEGSANSKAIEIYNPTNSIIELNRYYIARYSNGQSTYTKGGITQLQGFIQPRSTFVLVNGQKKPSQNSPACDPDLQALAQQLDHEYPSPTYMNGNDVIALYYDTKGNGKSDDFAPIDLFGAIGKIGTTDEGWAPFTDTMIIKNIYEGDQIIDKDTAIIKNYLVPAGFYWLPWTSNHTLVRKPSVLKGVTENPAMFIVTQEWDTAAGGVNIWDSLGSHTCDCEHISSTSKLDNFALSIYPNPAFEKIFIQSPEKLTGITISTMDGKYIYSTNILDSSLHPIAIDVSTYHSGIYFFSITSVNKTIVKKVVIK